MFYLGGFSGAGIFNYGDYGSSCTGPDCPSSTVIWLSILGGIIGILSLIFGVAYCIKYWNGRPRQSNILFIRNRIVQNCEQEKSYMNIFQSGYWKSQYFQYGKWHGSRRFSLSFKDGSHQTVTGSGTDDVGKFTIQGIYSTESGRLGLTKVYQKGTGNPSQNLGHQVTIQLTWNPTSKQFEGKWYVQTKMYHGENKFELKFDGHHLSTVYEKI